jgi:hypothetical protein
MFLFTIGLFAIGVFMRGAHFLDYRNSKVNQRSWPIIMLGNLLPSISSSNESSSRSFPILFALASSVDWVGYPRQMEMFHANCVMQMIRHHRERHFEDLSKQVRPVKTSLLGARQKLNIEKFNWQPPRPRFIHTEVRALVAHNDSNAGRFQDCGRHHGTVLKVGCECLVPRHLS